MRIVTNKELSNFKVLPFDLYTENKGKILEAGEVLTPGKLIMLKNYVKIYTEEFHNDEAEKKEVASGDVELNAIMVEIDDGTNKTVSITRIRR